MTNAETLNAERIEAVSKPRKVQKNYINNPDFHYALDQYIKSTKEAEKLGKQLPRMSNYIGECFDRLCNKIASRPNFYGYSFKDEMIGDGIENCIMAAGNYNADHPLQNPFGYFTRIIWQAYVRRILKEEKQTYIKLKNFRKNYVDDGIKNEVQNDIDEFIAAFEEKHLTKAKKSAKVKKKSKGLELFLEGADETGDD